LPAASGTTGFRVSPESQIVDRSRGLQFEADAYFFGIANGRNPILRHERMEILWSSFEKHSGIASRKRKSLWFSDLTRAIAAAFVAANIASSRRDRGIFGSFRINNFECRCCRSSIGEVFDLTRITRWMGFAFLRSPSASEKER